LAVKYDSIEGTEVAVVGHVFPDPSNGGLIGRIALGYSWMRWGERWTVGLDVRF
jgi:hypothetical protein